MTRIGVVTEHGSETRVAATPATVKQLIGLGYDVVVETGAGEKSSFPDEAYAAVGAAHVSASEAIASDIVLKVNAPTETEIALLEPGTTLITLLSPALRPDLLQALAGRAQNELTPLERYNLVDDTWASVMAGTTSVAEYKDFVRGFADETDLSVWQRVVGTLATLDRIVPDDGRERLQAFVRALVAPALQRLGDPADGELERTSALRAALFEALGELGADESVVARAREHVAAVFAEWERRLVPLCHRAAAEGSLRPGVDPDRLARILIAQFQGMILLGKTARFPAAEIAAALHQVIDSHLAEGAAA